MLNIIVRQDNKYKNITIKLLNTNRIQVNAPKYCNNAQIETVINNYKNKIIKKMEKMVPLYDLESKEKWILLFGIKTSLILVHDQLIKKKYLLTWIDQNCIEVKFNNNFQPNQFYNYFLKNIKSEFALHVKSIITKNIKKMPIISNYDVILKLKRATSIWGSCVVNKKIINVNIALIHVPNHLLNYLIIHELCHFYESNHSAKFWSHVEKYDPSYNKNRKDLKNYFINSIKS